MPTLYLGYSHTVVEDCEDAWVGGGGGHTTVTLDTTIEKVGSGCAKCAATSAAATDELLMYEAVSIDLSAKNYVAMWVYSSVTLAAGEIQFGYSEASASMASGVVWYDLPAISTVNSWHRIVLTLSGTTTDRNAILSVGFRMHVAIGEAVDFYVDDIEAFIGNDYTPLGVRGITDPDDVQNFPGKRHQLLDGSSTESLGPYVRFPTADLGVLQTKSDRVFVHTWRGQTDKVLYYDNEECQVVMEDPSMHTQEWYGETEIGRAVVLKCIEKTAWTTAPPSWSR